MAAWACDCMPLSGYIYSRTEEGLASADTLCGSPLQ